jgi:competence protein ComEC
MSLAKEIGEEPVAAPRRSIGGPLYRAFIAEQDRWRLWSAVFFATGCGSYFGMVEEPPVWLGAVLTLGALGLGIVLRSRLPWVALALFACAWTAAGFWSAVTGTRLVDAPMLLRPVQGEVIGRVLAVEPDGRGGGRLLIIPTAIDRLTAGALPARVRITVRQGPVPRPGDGVRLRASLSPPSLPVVPGGHDFARSAFFQALGGIGFAYARPEIVPTPPPSEIFQTIREAVERLRLDLDAVIRAAAPGEGGAVLSAMVTGLRGAIGDQTETAMRDSGLAHLISISGLHMTMVAGLIFGAVRLVMAFLPRVSDRWPGRKIAALAALLGAAAYLAVGGFAVPTQRAFVMTGLGLLAILTDRPVLSLPLVASSAIVVLVLQPAALIGPSFQMSFAAVVALIALYESPTVRRLAGLDAGTTRGLPMRAAAWVFGLLATSMIAGAATAPYAAYAFGRASGYGLVSNLVAVPVTGFWIMPVALTGSLLSLVSESAAGICFALAARGMELVIATATTVAGWPGAVVPVAGFSVTALLLMTFGGLWLVIWRRAWRWAGLAAIALGLVLAARPALPDLFLSGDGRSIALRGFDGALYAMTPERDRFVLDQWAEKLGTLAIRDMAEVAHCDGGDLCRLERAGLRIAITRGRSRLAEACAAAELVVAGADPRRDVAHPGRPDGCATITLVERTGRGFGGGAVTIRLDEARPVMEGVVGPRGDRPWTR